MASALDAAIVGAQKSGTTALAEFLGTHPGVQLPTRKELHAFDRDEHDWDEPDVHELLGQHFADAPSGTLRLEATPITMYWPRAVERMVALCPGIRTIVLLREPVSRAWSHWRMEVAKGKDDLPFGRAIREGRERVRSAPQGHHRVYSYVERGFYADQLDRLRRHVPDERILVLRQADLLDDHDATLRRVHDFLGLAPPTSLPAPRVVHSYADRDGGELDPDDAAHLRDVFADDLDRLAHEHGIELRTDPPA